MRTLVTAAALLLTAGAAEAQSFQGGIGAAPRDLAVTRPETFREREVVTQIRKLRQEVIAIRDQNGGVLPPADRDRLQARFDQLRAELKRAG